MKSAVVVKVKGNHMTELHIFWAFYISLCALYLGFVTWISSRRSTLLGQGIVTKARVVELHVFRGEEGPDLLTAEVCFKALDGRRYQVKVDSTCDPNKYRIGQQVAVRYEAAHPSHAIRADQRWKGIGVHAVICASMIAFGLYLHFKVEHRRQQSPDIMTATARAMR